MGRRRGELKGFRSEKGEGRANSTEQNRRAKEKENRSEDEGSLTEHGGQRSKICEQVHGEGTTSHIPINQVI
jgi:hypothetical protein